MPETASYLTEVGDVTQALTDLGLEPILVGGMALVLIGSQRVTRDFDFVIPSPGEKLEELVGLLYDYGFELVARLDEAGQVRATIDTRKVAGIRLRLDAPASAYFYKPSNGLRIDLLFDFPLPATTLARGATALTISSRVFRIASEADLLRLKQIAKAQRSLPSDAQDVAFLEARRRTRASRTYRR